MSQPFIAEIKMFAGNYAPRGFAHCNGQVIAIAQNTALFSLVGTTYGGNGTTTFALPDLRGRTPLGTGSGNGLTNRVGGEVGGTAAVTLLSTQIPNHSHAPACNPTTPNPAPLQSPSANVWAVAGSRRAPAQLYTTTLTSSAMSAAAVGINGGSQPHNNRQPYLGINFIIAMQGIFPARN